jgi:hypothetical protein
MRLLLTAVVISFCSASAWAQKNVTYVHGTLSGAKSFTGYFWFDKNLTQMGQRILYKETADAKRKKT